MQNGLFWVDGNDAKEWAAECAKDLESCFGKIWPRPNGSDAAFAVELHAPTADDAKKAWQGNLDLTGRIVITWREMPGKPVSIELPLPFHGIFLRRRPDNDHPCPMAWSAPLGELPGQRWIKTAKPGVHRLRLGFRHGRYFDIELGSKKARKQSRSERLFLGSSQSYAPRLQPWLPQPGLPLSPPPQDEDAWPAIWVQLRKIVAEESKSISTLTDEDDLNHRALITFPLWLTGRPMHRDTRLWRKGAQDPAQRSVPGHR